MGSALVSEVVGNDRRAKQETASLVFNKTTHEKESNRIIEQVWTNERRDSR